MTRDKSSTRKPASAPGAGVGGKESGITVGGQAAGRQVVLNQVGNRLGAAEQPDGAIDRCFPGQGLLTRSKRWQTALVGCHQIHLGSGLLELSGKPVPSSPRTGRSIGTILPADDQKALAGFDASSHHIPKCFRVKLTCTGYRCVD